MDSWEDVWESDDDVEEKEGEIWDEEDGYLVIKHDKGGNGSAHDVTYLRCLHVMLLQGLKSCPGLMWL